MYCPVCKAEYRPGFTHCSDCDVDLVTQLPAEVPTNAPRQSAIDAQDAPTDEHGNLLLWSGIDPRVYDAICNALDASHIAHTDTDREFGLPSLGQKVMLIWVSPRDWTTASPIRDEALKEPGVTERDDVRLQAEAARLDPFWIGRRVYNVLEGRENPSVPVETDSRLEDDETSEEPAPDDISAGFNPGDATKEIWSGADGDMAETVRVCLRENGIGCVVEERDGAQAVLVTPESETRAKEIVDQIVRGTPS
jgi:hypothetical protein